jgi:hypothetical protein
MTALRPQAALVLAAGARTSGGAGPPITRGTTTGVMTTAVHPPTSLGTTARTARMRGSAILIGEEGGPGNVAEGDRGSVGTPVGGTPRATGIGGAREQGTLGGIRGSGAAAEAGIGSGMRGMGGPAGTGTPRVLGGTGTGGEMREGGKEIPGMSSENRGETGGTGMLGKGRDRDMVMGRRGWE